MFVQWLASSQPEPYGSYGNGAAMRIASVGWVASSVSEAVILTDKYTEITHNHPDGIISGRATALAVYYCKNGEQPDYVAQALAEYYDLDFEICDTIADYKRTEVASKSVPQAIVCALEVTSFEDAIRKAISLGGDTDIQAAIAGGIAEARFGVPDDIKNRVLQYLKPEMKCVIDEFYNT